MSGKNRRTWCFIVLLLHTVLFRFAPTHGAFSLNTVLFRFNEKAPWQRRFLPENRLRPLYYTRCSRCFTVLTVLFRDADCDQLFSVYCDKCDHCDILKVWKQCDFSGIHWFVSSVITNVLGDAAGNSFPRDTIPHEPNVSNVITAVYSSPPTSLCSTLIASRIVTSMFNRTQPISILGEGIPNY